MTKRFRDQFNSKTLSNNVTQVLLLEYFQDKEIRTFVILEDEVIMVGLLIAQKERY